MIRIEKGDKFRYIKDNGGYFTKGKTYTVEYDMLDCLQLENMTDVIAFRDDEGSLHFVSESFLYENFVEVADIKENLQHEVICKGLALKWGKRLNTGIMGEDECKEFMCECHYFGATVEDVLNEIEDMENHIN
jgi:hypothetical protein